MRAKPIKATAPELELSRKVVRKAPESAFNHRPTVQTPSAFPITGATNTLVMTANEVLHRRDRLRITRIGDLLFRERLVGACDAIRPCRQRWAKARRKDPGDGQAASKDQAFRSISLCANDRDQGSCARALRKRAPWKEEANGHNEKLKRLCIAASLALSMTLPHAATAQSTNDIAAVEASTHLPSPLRLSDVTAIALQNRTEIIAAKARAEALAQRPAIVASLEDPMISASVDHYPFTGMMDGGRRYDRSISVEQKLPLSGVLSHRRSAALADADRATALADVTELDVVLGAQRAFFMLFERRRMQPVVDEQIDLAGLLVDVAASRYASGRGTQADVLRAEAEIARLKSKRQSLNAQVRGGEAMLNAALGRPVTAEIPELSYQARLVEPGSVAEVLELAEARPELAAGTAEVRRAGAESRVMRSMYKPMATVKAGYAETMAEGPGAMLMVGISVPIWRKRLSSGVAEAQAMQRMADADLAAMRRMVAGEALAAREEVVAAQVQVNLLRKDVLPRAKVAFDAALGSYSSGQGSLFSVIDAAQALWQTQGDEVMAESALGGAWAKLERATGERQWGRP